MFFSNGVRRNLSRSWSLDESRHNVFQRSRVLTRPNPFSNQGRHLSLVDLTVRWSVLVSKLLAVELGAAAGFRPAYSGWSARPLRLVSGGYGLRRRVR